MSFVKRKTTVRTESTLIEAVRQLVDVVGKLIEEVESLNKKKMWELVWMFLMLPASFFLGVLYGYYLIDFGRMIQ